MISEVFLAMKKERDKQVYKRFYVYLGVLFALIPALFLVLNILAPDRKFSEKENRMLSEYPEGGIKDAVLNKGNRKYETYVNDQFAGRDGWISLKAGIDRVFGKNLENGVWYGDDDYLMEAFVPPLEQNLNNQLRAIKSFAESNADKKQYFVLVPNAVSILADKLPAGAPEADQNAYIDRVKNEVGAAGLNFIDVRGNLASHAGEEIYYKTDHHWTTLGAFYGFEMIKAGMDLNGPAMEYEKLLVSDKFQGTLSAKSGFHSGMTEEMHVYVPKEEDALESLVYYVEEREKTASFYKVEKLETRDKYAMFFGGNHSQIRIYTPDATGGNLLIFKDSYANCLVPFLTPYFKKIILIDPRYYSGNIRTLMLAENINQIMYLYNANTFFADTSLEIVLEEGEKRR